MTMISLPGGRFIDNFGRGWRRCCYGYLFPVYNCLWRLKHAEIKAIGLPCMGDSWFHVLWEEFKKDYFVQLSEKVAKDRENGEVYPSAEDVFLWTRYCAIYKVKVVILGQDPYRNSYTHGLAFSVENRHRLPASLRNIFEEIAREGFKKPIDGDLTRWAKEGVVLLNTVLTYCKGERVTTTGKVQTINAHMDQRWKIFTDEVIRRISSYNTGVVFMLWGNHARAKAHLIDKGRNHLILESSHPSPLSAYKGFFGCGHFSVANEWLTEQGKTPINW